MKKHVTHLLLACCLGLTAFGAVACGGSQNESESSISPTSGDLSSNEELEIETNAEFYYELINNDTEYELIGLKEYTDTDIIIPSTYNGLPVTSIYYQAFYRQTELTSITICEGIKEIQPYAFQECSGLTKVVIPNSVSCIGAAIFTGCSALIDISLPFVLSDITVDMGSYEPDVTYKCPFGSFFGSTPYMLCQEVEQVYYNDETGAMLMTKNYIPMSLKRVTITGGTVLRGAFENCTSLTNVTIEDTVTSIGDNAFMGCSNLAKLTIGTGIASIGDGAFFGCQGLQIYYKGSREQWLNIDTALTEIPVENEVLYYYSANEPICNAEGTAYDGNYWRYVRGIPTIWTK